METNKILTCSYCNYTSKRNFNLKRHEISKHSKEIMEEIKENSHIKNVVINNLQYFQNENNDILIDKNVKKDVQIKKDENIDVIPEKIFNFCSKCNKKYLTIKSLKNHEDKCLGIDKLTCPRCMVSFTDRGNKSRHIKKNNCKAKSIIYARQATVQNPQIIQNIKTQINNDNRIINNNTFIINNYGNERLDYLSEEDMLSILTSGKNTIPLFIEKKHFNKEFPENNNVLYDDKSKKCKIKENNTWKNMNLSMVSSKLIADNSSALLLYFDNNKELLNKKIKNEEIYDYIIEKLLYIKHKNDKEQYNNLFNIIKFLIEGSNKLIQ